MNSLRALVVDDKEDVLEVNAAVVEFALPGCQVIKCTTLEGALEVLKNGGPLALVFTDFQIPDGTEGAQIVEAARKHCPNTPVIVNSGNMSDQVKELCKADAHFSKPCEFLLLVNTIKRLAKVHERLTKVQEAQVA